MNRRFALMVATIAATALANAADDAAADLAGLEALRVPAGFEVSVAAPSELTAYPMFMEFDDEGRLYIAESSGKDLSGKEMVAEPECTILRLEDTDRDGVFDTRTVFAESLSLPMGVLWHQGSLFVASPPDFIRFKDTDDDGVADEREVLLTGWNILNTASLHGPFLGPDGWLYLTHGRHGYDITSKEGVRYEGLAPRIWRCRPDGTGLERFAGGGFDNPVELVFLPGGDMIGTMTYFTDPRNGERDALLHFVEGGVYPKPHPSIEEFTRTGDLMPVMTKFARIAPSGLWRYEGAAFGDEYDGNLFSAQFNPHRVQRHVLIADGATYRTEDSDFLTSVDPDFHPTDVIEDADGSLLVSDTGAWYVDACPISRVARPEIKGAIYRITKTGANRPHDAWGRQLHMDTLDTGELVALLDDNRPKVRAKARERLAALGEKAVPALREALDDNSARKREAAVWLLGRHGDASGARVALQDSEPTVRMAAGHVAGQLQDAATIEDLKALLTDPHPAVQRIAATAIGQIGNPEAAPALLAAAGNVSDRFTEHAIIYAAIQLGNAQAAREALGAEASGTRKAALIALDQMNEGSLTGDDVAPFLRADDPALRKTGLWVASRHPDWSEVVVAYLRSALAEAIEVENATALREVLLAYASNSAAQEAVGNAYAAAGAATETKLFLLQFIQQASVDELPSAWNECISMALESSQAEVRWAAVNLIQRRTVATFDEALLAIADDEAEPTGLRLAAIEAALPRNSVLNEERFAYVVAQLAKENDPTLRMAAGKILANAELTAEQAQTVAGDTMAQADALTLPFLVDAVRGGGDEALGLAVVESLKASSVNPSLLPGGIDAALAGFPESVQRAAAPLRAQAEAEAAERIERLKGLEPRVYTGDVGRGRRVFFGEKAACYTCHAVGEEGGRLGPDLTKIGTIRSSHDLLEAVLFPSASMVPGYESYRVETPDDIYSGVISEETPEAITLKTGVDAEVRIPRDGIEYMALSPVSVMPEGLDVALSEQELLDLMAFLLSLNDEQWLLPEQRETAAR